MNQHIFKVMTDASRITKEYMCLALNRAVGEIEENLHGGVGLVHITKGNLEKIRIPLPSLEIQRQIAAEVEGYQRIIDGARQVVDHYRTNVFIEKSWETVKLGSVLLDKPKNGYSGSPVDYATDLKVLSLSATSSGTLDLTKYKYIDERIPNDSPCRCRLGDIYLQRGNTRELVGTAALFNAAASDYIYPDLMIRIRADETKIDRHFLLAILQGAAVREYLKRHAAGAAGSMPKINQVIVANTPIPLPPLATQRAIVAEIEVEQALVNANRELIRRMETKIKAVIDRVWGNAQGAEE